MNDLYKRLQSNKVEYKLSILILSLPSRLDRLSLLLKTLQNQTIKKPVQILTLGDNKSMSVGEKRNMAMSLAKGRYMCFIDDDDMVSNDYVDSILEAIELSPEVITFNVMKFSGGKEEKTCKFYYQNGNYSRISPDRSHYKMMPNHLCVWRKDVIIEEFPHKTVNEDHVWAMAMDGNYIDVVNIDKVLYHYLYDKDVSETH